MYGYVIHKNKTNKQINRDIYTLAITNTYIWFWTGVAKATIDIWLDKYDYESVPITTNIVSSNTAHGEVCSR